MAFVTYKQIKQEIENFLRNQDIMSVGTRGVTTSQDTGTFSSDSTYTVATNPTLLKNIRDITVGGDLLDYGADYTVDLETGVISFVSAQTGAYTINYDQGATDKIFPDFPDIDLTISQYPRIGFDIISDTTEEIEIGAGSTDTSHLISFIAYSADQDEVESLLSTIKEKILTNKKNFFYFPIITKTGAGPLIVSPFGKNKVMEKNMDFITKFVLEN